MIHVCTRIPALVLSPPLVCQNNFTKEECSDEAVPSFKRLSLVVRSCLTQRDSGSNSNLLGALLSRAKRARKLVSVGTGGEGKRGNGGVGGCAHMSGWPPAHRGEILRFSQDFVLQDFCSWRLVFARPALRPRNAARSLHGKASLSEAV